MILSHEKTYSHVGSISPIGTRNSHNSHKVHFRLRLETLDKSARPYLHLTAEALIKLDDISHLSYHIMFDILKLPREIRDMIYGYALVVKEISVQRIDQSRVKKRSRSSWPAYPPSRGTPFFDDLYRETYRAQFHFDLGDNILLPQLRLFLTNRQIYTESSQAFYEHNCFRFELASEGYGDLDSYRAFWHDRPLTAKASIRHLYLGLVPFHYGKFSSCFSQELVPHNKVDEILDCTSLDTLEICLRISAFHPFLGNVDSTNSRLVETVWSKSLQKLVLHSTTNSFSTIVLDPSFLSMSGDYGALREERQHPTISWLWRKN